MVGEYLLANLLPLPCAANSNRRGFAITAWAQRLTKTARQLLERIHYLAERLLQAQNFSAFLASRHELFRSSPVIIRTTPYD
jgi:hypothetical protein